MIEFKPDEYALTRVQVGGRMSHELSVYEAFIIHTLAAIQKDINRIKEELGIES